MRNEDDLDEPSVARILFAGAVLGYVPAMTASEHDPARDSAQLPTPAGDAGRNKTGRNISLGQILAGILLVLVVVFIVENSRSVPIRFIAGPEVRTPVYLAILIAAVVGGLIGALLRARRAHSAKKKNK